LEPAELNEPAEPSPKTKRRTPLKIRIREMVFLSAAMAFGAFPALAQDATATVATPAATAPDPAAEPAPKPPSWGVPEGRTFFPHNWLRGYVNFDIAPPHNEPDLGRCSQSHAAIVAAGGANSDCNAYARYLMGGYLEIQPFGKTLARHLFVFFTPTFSFGNNVPQFKYTASMAGIAFERAVGFGFELPKNLEFRVTQHQVDWLGKYNHNVGLADVGAAGPYGLYTTIGARWYFGGYGRAHEGQ
jgi:hypothetical protein